VNIDDCGSCKLLSELCLQLICGSDSPVTVTPDLSPVAASLQGLHEENVSKLSAKNVSEYADWERCAKEFASDVKVVHVGGKLWRKAIPLFQGVSARHQPKARKRLASALACEILPSNLSGNLVFKIVWLCIKFSV